MSHIITLTTDFGTSDPYVAAMKGVILSINPDATIVDISHGIEPQNIHQAAYILHRGTRYHTPIFPKGAIHVVVVDPGVGTQRRALVVKASDAFFIAPDNGVLSYMINEGFEAVQIINPHFWRHPVSSTFHGRDIFAPVAAHLSLGTPLHEFGEPVSPLVTFPGSQPKVESDGSMVGHVILIDRFGNLITDMSGDDLPQHPRIEVGGEVIEGLSSSYAEGNELVALIDSDEHLEIGVRNGNAARSLNLGIGDEIIIKTR